MADTKEDHWRNAFRKLLSLLPKDYVTAKGMAEAMSHVFHQELAAAMAPRLNAYLKTAPQGTHQERQALASWCNHELHTLGLCIRCPRTGRPSILLADVRGRDDDTSRFRLQARDESGQTSRTYSSKELPYFELTEDPPRREGLSRWRRGGAAEPPPR